MNTTNKQPPAPAAAPKDLDVKLGLPAGALDVLLGMRIGKPITANHAKALITAGLAEAVEGGLIMTDAGSRAARAYITGDIKGLWFALGKAAEDAKGTGVGPEQKRTALAAAIGEDTMAEIFAQADAGAIRKQADSGAVCLKAEHPRAWLYDFLAGRAGN